MEERDKISFSQFSAVIFVGLFSPITRLLPKAVLEVAGISGWLSPLIALLPAVGYAALLCGFLNKRRAGEGLADLFIRAVGKPAGIAVCIISVIWMGFYAGFTLRSGAERLLSSVYASAHLPFFLITMGTLCTIGALGELRWLARSAQVFMLMLGITILLIFIFALVNIKLEYIWPPVVTQAGKIAVGAVPVLNVLLTMLYMGFLAGGMKNRRISAKKGSLWIIADVILIMIMMVITVGILGPELSKKVQYPFFIMMRNIMIFDVVERVESLIIILWVITDFVFVTMLLSAASRALQAVYGGRSKYVSVLPISVVMIGSSFIISSDAFKFESISRYIVPFINMIFAIVLVPVVLIIGRIRKKI